MPSNVARPTCSLYRGGAKLVSGTEQGGSLQIFISLADLVVAAVAAVAIHLLVSLSLAATIHPSISMMSLYLVLCASLLVCLQLQDTQAWMTRLPFRRLDSLQSTCKAPIQTRWMASEGSSTEDVQEEQTAAVNATDAATEIEEEPTEDPAVTALKAEIADWERKVKDMKRQVNNYQDRADDYTKAGYARKVAEMENRRRTRSVSA
jgi:hypothetical protein